MPQQRSDHHSFIRFIFIGGVNTLVSYAVYIALTPVIGYLWAYVSAFFVGVVISYVLSTRWVFMTRGSIARASIFPLVYAPQLLLGSIFLTLFVETLGIHQNLAILFVIALTLPVNYFLAKLILRFNRTADQIQL